MYKHQSADWLATLTYAHTGTLVNLNQAGDYTFSLIKPSEGSPGTVIKGKVANTRFTLTFAPAKVSGRDIPQTLRISLVIRACVLKSMKLVEIMFVNQYLYE